MIKKLFFIILSLAILVTGAIAFRKLNYWERSAAIFDYREMDRRFEGRGGRGGSGFDGRSREAYDRRGGRGPDGEFGERSEGRSSLGPGDGGRGGHGRGDFRRGKAVRLRNVAWFLAVFSAFTAVSVYLNRACLRIRKKESASYIKELHHLIFPGHGS